MTHSFFGIIYLFHVGYASEGSPAYQASPKEILSLFVLIIILIFIYIGSTGGAKAKE